MNPNGQQRIEVFAVIERAIYLVGDRNGQKVFVLAASRQNVVHWPVLSISSYRVGHQVEEIWSGKEVSMLPF